MMDFLNKLGETLASAGKDVGQKAKDLSGAAKLTIDIKSKEDYVQRMYAEIGRQYYEDHKNETEGLYEEMALVKEALEVIADMKKELQSLKGEKTCPRCGEKVGEDDAYCRSCGAKMEEDEIIVDAVTKDVPEEEAGEETTEEIKVESKKETTEEIYED